MSFLTTLKAGAIAAAMSVGVLAAVPAQAAPPSFGFSFNFGSGGGGGPGVFFNYNGKPKYVCLSDKQIYWQLQDNGFKKIQIQKSKGYWVVATARWHGDWYQLVINRCDGTIKQKKIKWMGMGDPDWHDPKMGIYLQFNM